MKENVQNNIMIDQPQQPHQSQGQRVAVQDEHTRERTRRSQIVSYVHPRSFLVRMDKTGSILRRNQWFLRGLHATSVSGGLGATML